MSRLLISVAAAALMSSAALAADIPAFEPAPVLAPVPVGYDWSGFYVGINGGYGWADGDVSLDFDSAGTDFFDACLAAGCVSDGFDYDVEGFLIGGHAGFNWQAGALVLGLEGDIDYSDMDGGGSEVVEVPLFAATEVSADTDYSFFGTFRGRLGVAWDRVLVYGTGGFAFAEIENSVSILSDLDQDFAGSEEDTEFGWTGGGGVEVAVTDNVTIGAEALYFDLGDSEVELDPIGGFDPPGDAGVSADFENTGLIARGRVSVKFNGIFGG